MVILNALLHCYRKRICIYFAYLFNKDYTDPAKMIERFCFELFDANIKMNVSESEIKSAQQFIIIQKCQLNLAPSVITNRT